MLSTNLQNPIDFKGQKFYVGLDVHKKSWAVTIRSMGIQVAHFTQPPGADTLFNYLQRNFPGGQYHSAYEAGFCGTSTHEQLRKLGIDNILVHAADIPATDKQKKNKKRGPNKPLKRKPQREGFLQASQNSILTNSQTMYLRHSLADMLYPTVISGHRGGTGYTLQEQLAKK